MRMCVIKNKDNTISCIPVSCSKNYYYEHFFVLCFVNKNWDIQYVNIIKRYFESKGFVSNKNLSSDYNKISCYMY